MSDDELTYGSPLVLTGDRDLSNTKCPHPNDIIDHIASVSEDREILRRFGSFSISIYDTAWVSMVFRKKGQQIDWLFPQCFDYILRTQDEDGTWPAYTSQVDGILNTLAALLAILTKRSLLEVDDKQIQILELRCTKAHSGVQNLLEAWDVENCDHVAFEIIVPSLIKCVEQFGCTLPFRGRKYLLQLYNQKMQHFTPDIIYSDMQTTILHSLEALQGLIDFDQAKHHCSERSGVCASPSSTAAYLMNSSAWDETAETYLRSTVSAYGGNGGVPSAFPTQVFEMSWALSTLSTSEAQEKLRNNQSVQRLATSLAGLLEKQNGLVGFTPGVVRDADDTARSLVLLQRLGHKLNLDPMVQAFGTKQHFRTYVTERNPSFSANCNVLLALIESDMIDRYQSHVLHALQYLLGLWESGSITDKWNLSPDYSHMLLCEALVNLLKKHDQGFLGELPPELVLQQIPLTLCQIVAHSIETQQEDGGWADSLEVTAFNILIITQCLSLSWLPEVKTQLTDSIHRGKKFIEREYTNATKDRRLWIEKTTYQPKFLKMTYCSAALYATPTQYSWSTQLVGCFEKPPAKFEKVIKQMFSHISLLQRCPVQSRDLVLIEATLWFERLKEYRCSIIPRDDIPMTEDKYVRFIPLIWVACSHTAPHGLSADTTWDMLLLSLLNYQVDEYMESVVARLDDARLSELVVKLQSECLGRAINEPQGLPQYMSSQYNGIRTSGRPIEEVAYVLTNYVRHILQHPKILKSPAITQKHLARQVLEFLLAHIEHNKAKFDAKVVAKSDNKHVLVTEAWQNYHQWVRMTGAEDTSCPFSFLFFSCLISKPGTSCFEDPQADYLSKSMARHLATMCRQYNDYGSAKRDAEEGTLNSLNFPEFQTFSAIQIQDGSAKTSNGLESKVERDAGSKAGSEDAEIKVHSSSVLCEDAKAKLLEIAEFERECTNLCLRNLAKGNLVPKHIIEAVQVFVNVTDLFGQIYVQQDIASKIKQ